MSKKRVFIYNGQRFDDPGDEFSIEDVRQVLAQTFPELATARHSEMEKGDVVEIRFAKKTTTKGVEVDEITVEYGLTQTLSGHCNVRHGLRLQARLEEGESPELVRGELMAWLRAAVQEEIDDALVKDGQPPRYYEGPRFQVMYGEYGEVGVFPTELRAGDLPGEWRYSYMRSTLRAAELRLDQAMDWARECAEAMGQEVVDCSDGDLSRLEQLPCVRFHTPPLNPSFGSAQDRPPGGEEAYPDIADVGLF